MHGIGNQKFEKAKLLTHSRPHFIRDKNSFVTLTIKYIPGLAHEADVNFDISDLEKIRAE